MLRKFFKYLTVRMFDREFFPHSICVLAFIFFLFFCSSRLLCFFFSFCLVYSQGTLRIEDVHARHDTSIIALSQFVPTPHRVYSYIIVRKNIVYVWAVFSSFFHLYKSLCCCCCVYVCVCGRCFCVYP